MDRSLISPRVLKGFKDYLPRIMISRVRMIQELQRIFTLYGFAPIDTPALEYSEILLGKGSAETDKQMFRFLDNGGRDIALRFDLTVPLARFIAMHEEKVGTPFRRYHIAPVWRAEKPQKGRFREFIQCDFDIIGTSSIVADAEVIALAHSALSTLDAPHLFRINNRALLTGLLDSISKTDLAVPILRALDKLDKQGVEAVLDELKTLPDLSISQIDQIVALINISNTASSATNALAELAPLVSGSERGEKGLVDLTYLTQALDGYGMDPSVWKIDLSIARGLDYYTGTVFETQLLQLPEIGSVCSGGRYDNLASLYTKHNLPGVGASIGMDRLLTALEELDSLPQRDSTTEVLVTITDTSQLQIATEVAHKLRLANISTEVYPAVGSLKTQLKYADRKAIPLAVIVDLDGKNLILKQLSSREQSEDLTLEMVVSTANKILQKNY